MGTEVSKEHAAPILNVLSTQDVVIQLLDPPCRVHVVITRKTAIRKAFEGYKNVYASTPSLRFAS